MLLCFNFTIQIIYYFESQFNSKLDSFVSLKQTLGWIKSRKSFMFASSFSGRCWWIGGTKKALYNSSRTMLKNLMYALLLVQRGRRVKGLTEGPLQYEQEECFFSEEQRWSLVTGELKTCTPVSRREVPRRS